MAAESFEDEEVARLLNDTFVPIKVDREERPDLDAVYMAVAQMMTGSGGWPLTVILTPDKKPFFAATYIPKESRFGRIGILDLIPRIRHLWKNERAMILASAEEMASVLRQPPEVADLRLDEAAIRSAYQSLVARFDASNGGFGGAPKFPSPTTFLFLLRHWRRTGDAGGVQMTEITLRAMRRGGIFDHVGYGFHRYSTDALWHLPHFEKMLYDQAMISLACLEAHQATGKAEYARIAREVFAYLLRDLAAPRGASTPPRTPTARGGGEVLPLDPGGGPSRPRPRRGGAGGADLQPPGGGKLPGGGDGKAHRKERPRHEEAPRRSRQGAGGVGVAPSGKARGRPREALRRQGGEGEAQEG
jgi:uncharacterized protein YyaL (SSP411 family)